MNGLVLADVHIVCVFGNVQIIAVGDVAEVAVFAGGHHVYVTVLFRFGNRFLGPRAGLHIAGHAVFHQVHGDHGELKCCAALDEQHFVVVRDVHQVPQILLGLVDDLLEDRGAVAHLHDAHSGAPVVHHFVPDLLQDRFRHGGGTGREIENAIVHKKETSCMLVLGLSPVGEQLCVWIEYNPLFQNRQWDFPDSFCGGQKFFSPM